MKIIVKKGGSISGIDIPPEFNPKTKNIELNRLEDVLFEFDDDCRIRVEETFELDLIKKMYNQHSTELDCVIRYKGNFLLVIDVETKSTLLSLKIKNEYKHDIRNILINGSNI